MNVKMAKEYRAMDLEHLTEGEYRHLEDTGMLYEYFPEASGSYYEDMERIDRIGQNGNNGESCSPPLLGDGNWPHVMDDSYTINIRETIEETYDTVNNPSHYELDIVDYQGALVQAIDVIKAVLTEEEFRGYLRGNLLKYHLRANKKNGDEDIQKADMYSNWLVEELE